MADLRQEGLDSDRGKRFFKQWRQQKGLPPLESFCPEAEAQHTRVGDSTRAAANNSTPAYHPQFGYLEGSSQTLPPETSAHTDAEMTDAHTDLAMNLNPASQREDRSTEELHPDNIHVMIIDNPSTTEESARPEPLAPPPAPVAEPAPAPTPNSPQLFDPRGSGSRCYTQHRRGKYLVYKHATAGARVNNLRGTRDVSWRDLHEEIKSKYGGNPFGMWGSERNWHDARWAGTAKLSRATLDDMFKTPRYREDPAIFRNTDQLFKMIEGMIGVGGSAFASAGIRIPGAPLDEVNLHYRCPVQCLKKLFSSTRFAGQFALGPEYIYEDDGTTRMYGELCQGDEWHRIQGRLPEGTTRGAAIFMSDATLLSKYTGGVQVHAVYVSLGNINKSVRENISQGAWMLVGFIPKSNFEKTLATKQHYTQKQKTEFINVCNRQVFHRCMEIITQPFQSAKPHEVADPDGIPRSVVFDFAAYGADLEEQCMICGTERNSCPHCVSKGKNLGDPGCQPRRSSEQILKDIKCVLTDFQIAHNCAPDPLEFWERGKKFGLNGVHKPFWARFPDFEITLALSPDLLHGFHKCYYDHIHKWNLTGLGADEYDTRLKAQIPMPGEKMFSKGISKVNQVAGKEHRALERVGVGLVAHSPDTASGVGSNQLTKATRAYIDVAFLAQLPIHTDKTLADYEASYTEFHRHKGVWIKNKSKRMKGKKNKKRGEIIVNDSWAIPKLHIGRHAPEHVHAKGTLDNYNTETMETLHKSHCKDPYDLTNHRPGWQKQMLRRLGRHEKLREYGEFLVWHQEQLQREEQQLEGSSESQNNQPPDDAFPGENALEDEQEDMDDRGDAGGDGGGSEHGDEDEDEDEQGNHDREYEAPRVHEGNAQERGQSGHTGHSASSLGAPETPETPETPQGRPINPTANQVAVMDRQTYAIAKKATYASVTIDELQQDVNILDFFSDLVKHPYFVHLGTRITLLTELRIWDSFQLRIPTSQFAPEPRLARIHAISALTKRHTTTPKVIPTQRSDAVFYLPHDKPGFGHSEARLHVPKPRLMGYIEKFTSISKYCSSVSGLHAVAKSKVRGRTQYECIFLDQVVRPCALSPIIKGAAARGVEGHDSLAHYQSFYLNKYRNPHEFAYNMNPEMYNATVDGYEHSAPHPTGSPDLQDLTFGMYKPTRHTLMNIMYTGPPPVDESELPEFDRDLVRLLRDAQRETDTYQACVRALAGLSTDDAVAQGSGPAASPPIYRLLTPIHHRTPRALAPPPGPGQTRTLPGPTQTSGPPPNGRKNRPLGLQIVTGTPTTVHIDEMTSAFGKHSAD
ncbi:hypothetical protein FRC11_007309 [Ceratobasidium sp. 423]|nr:hypothetical protein FRC11_007309 [Ceratobasidium sp. 423]